MVTQRGGLAKGSLQCFLSNARSLMNKLPELYHILYDESTVYDCLLFTESWLNGDVPGSLLDPRGQYTILRSDRKHGSGGGVCAFISKKLRCIPVSLLPVYSDIELICFDVVSCNASKYRFILFYRPPGTDTFSRHSAGLLCNALEQLATVDIPTFIATDLNCPSIDWRLYSRGNGDIDRLFADFMLDNGYVQHVTEATRGSNILDLVFCNEPILMSYVKVSPPFGGSDHNSVEFAISCDPTDYSVDSSENCKRYLWSEGDYESMSAYLQNVRWSDLLTTNFTSNDIWSAFCNVINNAIDLFVPCTTVSSRPKQRKRRYPRHVRNLINRKRAVWKHMKRNPDSLSSKIKYNRVSAECRLAMRRYECWLEGKIIDSNDTGAFYKFVNSKSSCRSGVGTLLGEGGELVTDDKEKADLLNNYFASVCCVDDGSTPHAESYVSNDDNISSISFTEANVFKAARRIKTKSKFAGDPDGYPIVLLHKLRSELCGPLSMFYNSFMSIGQLPDAWKRAVVTPVFKKGSSSDPANYRPISQTSIFCKLMERVITAELSDYLLSRGIINRHQHGFIAKHSTTTNLLDSLNDWTLAVENKLTETIAYVDFARAFDTVSPKKLLIKLQASGITGQLLSLITSFLSDRSQVTKVGSDISGSKLLTSGIVQGSCLGPLLFLIYINDVVNIFNANVTPKLYADDLKLYACLSCPSSRVDFQQNLDRLTEWASIWQLSISVKKCNIIQVGSRQKTCVMSPEQFVLCNNVLECVDVVNDLGILIDSHLTFASHIHSIVQKATQRCYLISKSFQSHNTELLVRAFTTYVRPLLEVNSQVWSPHLLKDIRRLETVQRRFTKKLNGLETLAYDERLKSLGLERLETRRIRSDLLFAYKVLFGFTGLRSTDFFILSESVTTRGHPYKLSLTRCYTDVRKYFFCNRVVQIWNQLPGNTDFSTIGSFKRALLSGFNLSQFCHLQD